MDNDELARQVASMNWFHQIDLGNGLITPGADDSRGKLERLGLPESLAGQSVLDVGAWDGFFSFEAERRGAMRVVALDSFVWERLGKGGFELARKALGSRVEDVTCEVLDISPEALGTFDMVLFLGVLYHMEHPLLALQRAFSVTGRQIIVESHVDMLAETRPVAAFYPGAEVNNDPTNWWGPNPAAIEAMLRAVGFIRTEVLSVHPLPETPYGRAIVHGWR
ncbi:MAG: DUF1698 domain-containing protein [Dehalococcoidia bacterium]|nr:DUF1698 domain-containing protein [Dehalococcoidia bacterium]